MSFFNRHGRMFLLAMALFLLVNGATVFAQPTVSTKQLHTEFNANQVRFEQNYKGKQFYINGQISQIRQGNLGGYVVALKVPNTWSVVNIVYPERESTQSMLARFEVGQNITVLVTGRDSYNYVDAVLPRENEISREDALNFLGGFMEGLLGVAPTTGGRSASTSQPPTAQPKSTNSVENYTSPSTVKAKKPADFVPTGYKILKEVKGDLNKDGLEDCALLIVGKQDESFRGIIIAFNRGGDYENMLENRNIFSYDKDEVSFVPDVDVTIKKWVLCIEMSERYSGGAISELYNYKFRFQNSDFELIGCDVVVVRSRPRHEVSINFLSKKMQTKDRDADSGKEFNEVWNDIVIKEPINLRNIVNLGGFNVMKNISVK